jgi:hypothetical protein
VSGSSEVVGPDEFLVGPSTSEVPLPLTAHRPVAEAEDAHRKTVLRDERNAMMAAR